RKGARTRAARRRRGTRAGPRWDASGSRRIEARRGTARHVEDRAPRRSQGWQNPRDPQARGPRRYRPHSGHLQPRDVAALGDRDAPRFRLLAQAYDGTDHRTLLRAAPATPDSQGGSEQPEVAAHADSISWDRALATTPPCGPRTRLCAARTCSVFSTTAWRSRFSMKGRGIRLSSCTALLRPPM